MAFEVLKGKIGIILVSKRLSFEDLLKSFPLELRNKFQTHFRNRQYNEKVTFKNKLRDLFLKETFLIQRQSA